MVNLTENLAKPGLIANNKFGIIPIYSRIFALGDVNQSA